MMNSVCAPYVLRMYSVCQCSAEDAVNNEFHPCLRAMRLPGLLEDDSDLVRILGAQGALTALSLFAIWSLMIYDETSSVVDREIGHGAVAIARPAYRYRYPCGPSHRHLGQVVDHSVGQCNAERRRERRVPTVPNMRCTYSVLWKKADLYLAHKVHSQS